MIADKLLTAWRSLSHRYCSFCVSQCLDIQKLVIYLPKLHVRKPDREIL